MEVKLKFNRLYSISNTGQLTNDKTKREMKMIRHKSNKHTRCYIRSYRVPDEVTGTKKNYLVPRLVMFHFGEYWGSDIAKMPKVKLINKDLSLDNLFNIKNLTF
jgi:hypothetical protein